MTTFLLFILILTIFTLLIIFEFKYANVSQKQLQEMKIENAKLEKENEMLKDKL